MTISGNWIIEAAVSRWGEMVLGGTGEFIGLVVPFLALCREPVVLCLVVFWHKVDLIL